ncbi:sortase B protein-sorting domain-containing protein [Flavobacterium sp.]
MVVVGWYIALALIAAVILLCRRSAQKIVAQSRK